MARFFFRIDRALWAIGLLAGLFSAAGGCASFSKQRVDENVVAARQLAMRGMDAMQRGQYPDAETLFEESLQLCPLDERTHRHYAQMLWRRGAHEPAIAHMEDAVRLSGGAAEMLVELGDMYLARGDLALAEQQADRALAASRQLPAAWALKGDVLQRQGRTAESLANYHRALAYREHYPRVQFAVAELYRNQGNSARSLATLQALEQGYPPDQVPASVFFHQGLALRQLHRHNEAIERLATARQLGDNTPELLVELAGAQMQIGDIGNARLSLQTALATVGPRPSNDPLSLQIAAAQRQLAVHLSQADNVREQARR